MIPCIKSFNELMLTSKSREKEGSNSDKSDLNQSTKSCDFLKTYIVNKRKSSINLPNLPKFKRHKWAKSKEAVSRFFDELDYNNQIQSSYDLTLIERQNSYDRNDVA